MRTGQLREQVYGCSLSLLLDYFLLHLWVIILHKLSLDCLLQLYPRDLACIATMLTFEYISQLCQNKEWVCPPSDPKAAEGESTIYVLASLMEQRSS